MQILIGLTVIIIAILVIEAIAGRIRRPRVSRGWQGIYEA